jgi:hypothetical protein
MRSVMRHAGTGNETDHNPDHLTQAAVQGGPPVPASSVTTEAQAIVLRVVCAWCPTVIREGSEPASHGICPPCANRQMAEIAARIRVYAPLHVIPAQDRNRLLADHLDGINKAAAIAHILNNAVAGYGLCVLHLNERRRDGTCFGCAIGAPRHPWAAVGR